MLNPSSPLPGRSAVSDGQGCRLTKEFPIAAPIRADPQRAARSRTILGKERTPGYCHATRKRFCFALLSYIPLDYDQLCKFWF